MCKRVGTNFNIITLIKSFSILWVRMATITKEQSRNYFKKQKKCLKLVGISFTGNESIAYRLYSFVLIFLVVCGYTFLDGWELFKHDFETFSHIIIYESILLITTIEATISFKNRIQFGKILDKLEQEPFLPNPNRGGVEEERLIQECNWIIDMQTYGFWIATSLNIMTPSAYALSTRIRSKDPGDWMLPFETLTALNITYSPNYEISWFCQTFSVFVVGGHFTTIDLTLMGILAHISYHFKILQNYFRIMMTRCYEEMLKDQNKNLQGCDSTLVPIEHQIDPSKIPWKYLKNSIRQAVSYHQAIMDFAEEIEIFFRYVLLMAFLVSLSCLTFELYLVAGQTTTLGLLRNIVEFMGCGFQIATVCYWGEQVLIESENVSKAILESNFVGADLRFQKALNLMLRRSQRPTKLTAGKFAVICLTTFAWVMRTTYSVFMFIRNTSEKKHQ